ncbi:MAG TPA: hypothetical protein VEB20_12070, partial [Azospirillaceae bacterium]|nr:hypothetical protein [Azospirillaceae bacterium]
SWTAPQGADGFGPLLTLDTSTTSVAGTGDFNADGKADPLFRLTSGALVTWNRAAGAAGFTLLDAAEGQQVRGIGNLVGGAGDDLLLAQGNRLNIVDGGTGTLRHLLDLASGFSVAGVGNLDGTGGDDVLFLNGNTNSLLMLTDTSEAQPDGFVDLLQFAQGSGWRVEAVGDFLGGGADDLLFFNTVSRELLFWDVSGGNAGFRDFIRLPEDWRLIGIGDVDGNGRDDVVLRNTGSGESIYWTGEGFLAMGSTLNGVQLLGIAEFG